MRERDQSERRSMGETGILQAGYIKDGWVGNKVREKAALFRAYRRTPCY
jgi:hypothetical protein